MALQERDYGTPVAIVVDEQNDFFPDGALGVAGSDNIIDPTNTITEWVRNQGGQVIFTRDKHNPETRHFDTNGGQWPVHCVTYPDILTRPQGTEGAALHPDLVLATTDLIASKGMRNEDDGYSGAEAIIETTGDGQPTAPLAVEAYIKDIAERNRKIGKRTLLIVMGLAADYCVGATVLDLTKVTDREWAQIYVLSVRCAPSIWHAATETRQSPPCSRPAQLSQRVTSL